VGAALRRDVCAGAPDRGVKPLLPSGNFVLRGRVAGRFALWERLYAATST